MMWSLRTVPLLSKRAHLRLPNGFAGSMNTHGIREFKDFKGKV